MKKEKLRLKEVDFQFELFKKSKRRLMVAPATLTPSEWLQLKEHRDAMCGGSSIAITFTIYSDKLRIFQSNAKAGCGYAFVTCHKAYMENKKVSVKWSQMMNSPNIKSNLRIYDGSYERSDSGDFPNNSDILLKGGGILSGAIQRTGSFTDAVNTMTVNLTGSTQDYVTVFVQLLGHANYFGDLRIEYLKILDIDDTELINFDLSSVTMEQTGTGGDYGYTGAGP